MALFSEKPSVSLPSCYRIVSWKTVLFLGAGSSHSVCHSNVPFFNEFVVLKLTLFLFLLKSDL